MSTITPTHSGPSLEPLASPVVYRISVDEYERMAGMLDDPRVELIDGYLVRKMGKKPAHCWAVDRTEEALRALLPPGWTLRREGPVRIPNFDEPEPDLAVVKGPRDVYRTRHPDPADVTLLVEVAESSLDRDRGEKRAAYAKSHDPIAVYWIVNLIDRQVEVYTDPFTDVYRSCEVFKPGQDVPVVIHGVEVGRIAVADILP
ncbi:MAG: Uma2 family endonuclease [Isosphaerales bacterium]